ncbi:MAG: pitrilysin family protein [Gemmatimonadales bacterium]
MNRLFLIPLLLVAPLAAQDAIEVPYTQFRLPNGLNVILHQDRSTPMVSVNLWYHVGSGRETPGRTGFAHLFEHILFEGSENVPEGAFDQWLEAAGGQNNGSTNSDRTNYWENIPRSALELALFLESDRMGFLLGAMSEEKVDGQRDVVKNERRQSYENQPYGMAFLTIDSAMYPADHPYSWPTIGSMEDLSAASYQDVVDFFRNWYGPNNASLSIAGDIDTVEARRLVERWFQEIPTGPPVPPLQGRTATIGSERRMMIEDRVQLPRVYMCWHTPAHFAPGDVEMDIAGSVLAGGRNSRLYRRLVYEMEIAQDVFAFQGSQALGSQFCIISTARPGRNLGELEAVIQEELDRLRTSPPTEREIARVVNQTEAGFLDRLEQIGGFGGKADQLNAYYFQTGNPDYFNEDLSRYKAITPSDIRAAVGRWLGDNARVILSIVPQGRPELAAPARTTME